MEKVVPLPKLALEKWKTGRTHCVYLPGICIHACPAFPGSDKDLHYQPRDFARGTLILPMQDLDEWETHPALRPSRSATVPRSIARSTLSSLPTEAWENPAFTTAFLEAASGTPQADLPYLSVPRMSSSPRPKSAAPGALSPTIPPKSPLRESPAVGYPSPKELKPAKNAAPLVVPDEPDLEFIAKLIKRDQAFENTSTSVAASQMRNALNNLADTVTDPTEKKVRFDSPFLP